MACSRGCCETQAEHFRSVNLRTGPTQPTLTERRWAKDHKAYREMRRQGVQPRRLDGSHHLAQMASSQTEVEMGRVMPGAERRMFEEMAGL